MSLGFDHPVSRCRSKAMSTNIDVEESGYKLMAMLMTDVFSDIFGLYSVKGLIGR